ncbi:hypothetical protein V6Z12_A03G188300 [Gossypium hirsutum]
MLAVRKQPTSCRISLLFPCSDISILNIFLQSRRPPCQAHRFQTTKTK